MRRSFHNDGVILGLLVLVTSTGGVGRTGAPVHDDLARRVERNGAPQATGFKVVVVEGEDAVNIIQQKSAVAPVVEVRDRNDQPVAGALVRFAITRGRATFSGARALTVTTNAAGRAVAAGFTPTGTGVLQISASATFQGQTAVAAIVQTNVMTMAEAATVSSAGATGGSAGGAGAGGGAAGGAGGGLPATTLGVVGGIAAGSTIVATKVLSGGPTLTYAGPFVMSPTITRNYLTGGARSCTQTAAISGTVTADVQEPTDAVKGTLRVSWSETNTPLQQPASNCPAPPSFTISEEHDFESPASGIQVNWTVNGTDPGGPVIRDFAFAGVLNGDVITGTIAMSYVFQSPTVPESFPLTSAAVTLTKQ